MRPQTGLAWRRVRDPLAPRRSRPGDARLAALMRRRMRAASRDLHAGCRCRHDLPGATPLAACAREPPDDAARADDNLTSLSRTFQSVRGVVGSDADERPSVGQRTISARRQCGTPAAGHAVRQSPSDQSGRPAVRQARCRWRRRCVGQDLASSVGAGSLRSTSPRCSAIVARPSAPAAHPWTRPPQPHNPCRARCRRFASMRTAAGAWTTAR